MASSSDIAPSNAVATGNVLQSCTTPVDFETAGNGYCHCWSSPTNLFLVCRAMREHAQATFFAFNRFIIAPSSGCHSRAEGTLARLEISLFLSDVMLRTALCWLRFLEVVIPPFNEYYFRAYEPAHQEWLQTNRSRQRQIKPFIAYSAHIHGRMKIQRLRTQTFPC